MNRLTAERLEEFLDRASRLRIGVLGDFFLDRYLDVDPTLAERSVETGRIAHQVIDEHCSAGAAGTVVNNLAALGVRDLQAFGIIGDDGSGFELQRALRGLGCGTEGLLASAERMTPTYLKPRDQDQQGLAGEHSRYDSKDRRPLRDELLVQLTDRISEALKTLDGLIVVDQIESHEGAVIQPVIRDSLLELAKQYPTVPIVADSRFQVHKFRGVMLKPNQFEALDIRFPAPHESIDEDVLRERLVGLQRAGAPAVICTRGAAGVTIVEDGELVDLPGIRVPEPVDSTGAGDSFSAGLMVAAAAGGRITEAAEVGMLVASITVQQLGTTGTATPDAVRERFQEPRT